MESAITIGQLTMKYILSDPFCVENYQEEIKDESKYKCLAGRTNKCDYRRGKLPQVSFNINFPLI